MASPAKVLRGKNTTRTAAATQRLLAEVSRLVSYRYALPETFDGLLLHLRRALDVDIVVLALPDESRNVMQTVLFALWADTSRSAVRTSLQRQPLWQSLVDPGIIVVNDVADDRRWPTVMKKLPAAGIGTYCSVPLTAGEPLERVAAEQYRTLHRKAAAAIGEIAEAASGGGMAALDVVTGITDFGNGF